MEFLLGLSSVIIKILQEFSAKRLSLTPDSLSNALATSLSRSASASRKREAASSDEEPEIMFQRADITLYEAKKRGRNQIRMARIGDGSTSKKIIVR
jgi:GGDEF domain-containing protein